MEPSAKRLRGSVASSSAAGLRLDDVRRLIAEVRARPYLWDNRRADHRDLLKTRRAWMTIAERLGIRSADEWRKTWRNKRNYYHSIAAGTRRSSMDSWPYSRFLTFLDEVLNTGAMRSEESPSPPALSPPIANEKELFASGPVDAAQLLNERLSRQPPLSVSSTSDHTPQLSQEDEAFGRFVASTLSGIGEKKKRKVMLDIHRILVEAMDD